MCHYTMLDNYDKSTVTYISGGKVFLNFFIFLFWGGARIISNKTGIIPVVLVG